MVALKIPLPRIPLFNWHMSILLLAALVFPMAGAMGTVVTLEPVKDTTIFSENGNLSSALGDLFVGKTAGTAGTDLRRALIAFDVAGSIPADATIMSVTLTMQSTRSGSSANTITLHKLNQDWGEGTSNSSNGRGANATTNDATWTHRFFNTSDTWNQGGGDFSSMVSGSLDVSGTGTKTWNSTAQMVADVQDWLDNSSTNFGWILTGSESTSRSAKRFTSREGTSNKPTLTIDFTSSETMDQTINFSNIPSKTFGDGSFDLVAIASSDLPVTFLVTVGSDLVSLNGSTVTILGTGTVTIRASQAGDAQFNPAPEVPKSFSIAKAGQTITFGLLDDKVFTDASFTLSATSDSGLPVSFSIPIGSNLISLDGNSVSIVDVGNVTIRASQAGNANFNAATAVDRNFTISKADQSINFAAVTNKTVGGADFPLSATASSGLSVAFDIVEGSQFVSLDGNAVTILGAGEVTIEASQPGNTQFNAASTEPQTFSILASGQTITFNEISDRIFGDITFTLSATASSGLPVSFSVAVGSGLVNLSGDSVTILGAGNVTIRATQGGNDNFGPATPVDQSFAIAKADQTITFEAVGDLRIEESPFQLSATASSGLAITYSVVSGMEIASVEGSTLTLSGEGQFAIEASQPGNENYNAATPVMRSFQAISGPLVCQDVFCGEDIPDFVGWRASSWYLNYNVDFLPWIFHDEHGWQFLFEGSTEEVIFLWDLGLQEWVFTNEANYRWFFLFGLKEGFIFSFADNTPGNRFFQRADSGEIFSSE